MDQQENTAPNNSELATPKEIDQAQVVKDANEFHIRELQKHNVTIRDIDKESDFFASFDSITFLNSGKDGAAFKLVKEGKEVVCKLYAHSIPSQLLLGLIQRIQLSPEQTQGLITFLSTGDSQRTETDDYRESILIRQLVANVVAGAVAPTLIPHFKEGISVDGHMVGMINEMVHGKGIGAGEVAKSLIAGQGKNVYEQFARIEQTLDIDQFPDSINAFELADGSVKLLDLDIKSQNFDEHVTIDDLIDQYASVPQELIDAKYQRIKQEVESDAVAEEAQKIIKQIRDIDARVDLLTELTELQNAHNWIITKELTEPIILKAKEIIASQK